MTWRQYVTWLTWEGQYCTSLTDEYLIQLTYEVASLPFRVWGEKVPSDLKPDTFRLKPPEPAPEPQSLPKLPKGFPRLATKEDIAKVPIMLATCPRGPS